MIKPSEPYLRPNILYSFWYAIRGLGYTYYSQRNMKIHCAFSFIAIVAGLYFHLSATDWHSLIGAIALVLLAESFNTSIELSVDLTTKKKKIRAMLSKDVAAGAVLIAAIHALGVGYLIFFQRFVSLISGGS